MARRRRRIDTGGPWGSGLLFVGLGIIVLGINYLLETPDRLAGSPALLWINEAVPIRGWGLLWLGVGLYSVWKALSPPQRHADMAPAIGILLVWSAIYGLYFTFDGLLYGLWGSDYRGALIYLMFAGCLFFYGQCTNPPRAPRDLRDSRDGQ